MIGPLIGVRPVTVPKTATAAWLATIQVRQAQQIELASTSIDAIETAIADGQAQPGRLGCVLTTPAPRHWLDTTRAARRRAQGAGAYFAQLAGEREQAAVEPELSPAPTLPADLWQDVLAQLRLHQPRGVSGRCAAVRAGIA